MDLDASLFALRQRMGEINLYETQASWKHKHTARHCSWSWSRNLLLKEMKAGILHRKARPIENLPEPWIHRELNHLIFCFFTSIFFAPENKIPLILYSQLWRSPVQDHVGSIYRICSSRTFLSLAGFSTNRCFHVQQHPSRCHLHDVSLVCVPQPLLPAQVLCRLVRV